MYQNGKVHTRRGDAAITPLTLAAAERSGGSSAQRRIRWLHECLHERISTFQPRLCIRSSVPLSFPILLFSNRSCSPTNSARGRRIPSQVLRVHLQARNTSDGFLGTF